MYGGEYLMIKKLLCILCSVFMIFSLSFPVFAEEDVEYYEEYDNYSELAEDHYGTPVIPEQVEKEEFRWYDGLSPIPLVIGFVAGGLTVLILFRKQSIAKHHTSDHPYPIISDIRHTVISDTNDNTL